MTDVYLVATRTLTVLVPELILMIVAIAMMTAGPFLRWPRRVWAILSALALIASAAGLMFVRNTAVDPYAAVALSDAFSVYARLGLLITGLVILALAHDQVDDTRASEFFGALLLLQSGAMLVATANELVFLFVGLELVSLPTYLLLYLSRRTASTLEAATKYFYLSIFSSALFLFGLAYLYGLTGVSNLKAISYILHTAPAVFPTGFAVVALVFIMAGLAFRIAAVPLHFYAPDVYEGSPTVIAALLSWVPKAIGILAMIRVLTSTLAGTSLIADKAVVLCWVIAVITMTMGNTVALMQENLKRLFAYSSIAHAGYLMIGITAAFRDDASQLDTGYLGAQAAIFYLAAYAVMTLGAFGAFIALSTPGRLVETVDDLAGLGRTHPTAAFALALCLFSLAGIPPTAGFIGKYQIFASALLAGELRDARLFQALAVIGVLNAAVGAYYYLRIVVVMYFRPSPENPLQVRAPWPTWLAVGVSAGLSLVIGILPAPVNKAARESAVAAITQPPTAPVLDDDAEAELLPPVAAAVRIK
jgi:NADH-quinone oxidoreductase subunit N